MGERIRQDVLESFPDAKPYDTSEVAPILYGSKKRTFHAWLDEQTGKPLFIRGARGKRQMTRLHISRAMDMLEQCQDKRPTVANSTSFSKAASGTRMGRSTGDALEEARAALRKATQEKFA